MNINVQLFSTLRDCLPANANRGQATLTLPAGATLADLVIHLGIDRRLGYTPQEIITRAAWQIVVNGSFEPDIDRPLQEGDQVQIFPPVAGG